MGKKVKRKLCQICKQKGIRKESVIYMKEHRLALCKEHFLEWFEKRVKETVKEFKMFSPKERILVAVSGGKDSQTLWYVLNKLGYQADGFFINLGIGEYSEESLQKVKELGKLLGKEPYIVDLEEEVGAPLPTLKNIVMGTACSVCGRIKRYHFNKAAKKLGYKVVATGHNLDDESSSLLANLINWNLKFLARKFPVLPEEKGFPRKVKPLVKLTEEQIKTYADLSGVPYTNRSCPLGDTASLHFYKHLMEEIEDHARGTKYRFYFEFLKKVFPIFNALKEEMVEGELQTCKVCGEPSPSEICFVCKLKERLKEIKNREPS